MRDFLFGSPRPLEFRGLRWGRAGWLPLLTWLTAGLLLAAPARAQIPTNPQDPNFNPAAPPRPARADTATVRKVGKKERRALAAADSARRTERLFGLRVTRPQKAGFLALIPSGGQIYNRRYWKLPIVYGMVGGLGYWVFFQQRQYKNFKRASDAINVSAQKLADVKDFDEGYKDLATRSKPFIDNGLRFSRTQRDLSILVSALGYGLLVLDAVVDAHLRDFEVSDDLTLQLRPTLLPVPGEAMPATGLALTLRIR